MIMMDECPLPPRTAMVRASVLVPLRRRFAERGLRLQDVLRRHGLSAGALEDPYAKLPLARYLALFEDAAALLAEDGLGLKLGMRVRPADIGPVGVLFSLSASLRVAFARLAQYVKSVQDGTESRLIPEGDDYLWHYVVTVPGLWPRRQDAEFTLATCCQLARLCFAPGWRPLEVHFEHPGGANAPALRQFFRAPVHFGQSGNRLVVEGDVARRQHRAEDPGLIYVLERHIEDLMHPAEAPQSMREQVVALIGQQLGHAPVSLASLAAAMGTTARTLQRHLRGEGTSLRQLLQAQRAALAGRRLQDGAASMADIAQVLGYADRTAFWRAYKRWEGVPPSRAKRET
jgi:AraC-like DNA-binding protein